MTGRSLPIPFSAPMVQALLREIAEPGTGKTQTRRVIDFPGIEKVSEFAPVATDPLGRRVFEMKEGGKHVARPIGRGLVEYHYWPKYAVGDRLYVREHWRTYSTLDGDAPRNIEGVRVWYEADEGYKPKSRFRQGMHMPRWASRITLDVTEVRVERLQDIGTADVMAEGIAHEGPGYAAPGHSWLGSPEAAYRHLWDAINGPGAWDANPWVAAYSFIPRLGNIDEAENDDRA